MPTFLPCKQIKRVKIPRRLLGYLEGFVSTWDNPAFDKHYLSGEGYISLSDFPPELRLPYFLFDWICQVNEVIEAMNLILLDLRLLGTNPYLFEGSPEVRFDLLFRGYFIEVHRMKETFKRGLEGLVTMGQMDSRAAKEGSKLFYDKYKEAMLIRNNLVHNYLEVPGRSTLSAIAAAEGVGFVLMRRDSPHPVSLEKALRPLCRRHSSVFYGYGNHMRGLLQRVFDNVDRLLPKAAARSPEQARQSQA